MAKSISNQTSQWCTLSAQNDLMAWIERSECCHSEKHRRPSNKGSYGAWYRPLLRRWWFWCEWEQNSPNWDRNAIRRGKIGVGGQRATFTQYWFCSLSLKEQELVTEADEWCPFVLHSTCLFWQWRQHKAVFFFLLLQSLVLCRRHPRSLSSVWTERATTRLCRGAIHDLDQRVWDVFQHQSI